MEHDLTADASLVKLPKGFVFNIGDRVKRRRLDGTIDTLIVVPHMGKCSACDFPYKDKDYYDWEICLPNPGHCEKMCYRHSRGKSWIMFKSIDKVLEEL